MHTLIFVSFILFPFYVIALNIRFGWSHFSGLMSCFLVSHALYRTWETFFTSRDWRRLELHGDWTLLLSSAVYVGYHFFLISEVFLFVSEWHVLLIVAGVLLYGLSLRLRMWGEVALGKQWSIHAVGAKKVRKVRIIKLGPYKYIRHPIYLGIMIESMSLALMANALLSLIVAISVFIPIMVLRAFFEEASCIRRFGKDEYLRYKSQTNMLLPLRLFGCK